MSKILIIEDEKLMAQMYQERLEGSGFEVVLARNSKEGFEMAKEEKPDLIVLDILLPTENGVSCLARLKKEPETEKIPVIAFSNYDEPETRKETFKLGVEDYLLKTDFTPKGLVEKIKAYLEKQEA